MSVVVSGLTKKYGLQTAVSKVTFEAVPGQILAFLGPNGAGKTTTMKMLTGYTLPTEGTATVCGFDIRHESLEVRRRIGYLPEHNPLYKDMYVHEYLRFVARIRQVGQPKQAVAKAIAETGLTPEQNKLIGQLSKGYRQRVGLAAAILHNPQVLILDEPTSGLDPNQIVEIRDLIRALGRDKTVIFSSHILAEVEQLCDRVVIINRGVIVADDSLTGLRQMKKGQAGVTVEFGCVVEKALLAKIAGVTRVDAESPQRFVLWSDGHVDVRAALSALAQSQGWPLIEMRRQEQSTEDVFRLLTQTPNA